MRFTDFPSPLPLELYDEAANAYAGLVRRRTLAVYRTGGISEAGISDLDLIVVPAVGPRYDNYAYFSLDRLPQRLHPVFRHAPFLLPYEVRDVILRSTHDRPVLVQGRDVLQPRGNEQRSDEEGWSMLFGDYPRYRDFVEAALRSGRVHVRYLLSKLTSIRIPFETLDRVAGPAEPALCADAALRWGRHLRAGWFADGAAPPLRASEAWDVLRDLVDRLGRRIREAAAIPDGTETDVFAHAFLQGEPLIPGLDPARVLARQHALLRYHDAACPLNIRYEPLVPRPAAAGEVGDCWQRHRPSKSVRAIVRLQYGVDAALRGLRVYGVPSPAAGAGHGAEEGVAEPAGESR